MFSFERWIGYQGFLEQDLNTDVHFFERLDLKRENIDKKFVWRKGDQLCNIYFTTNGKISVKAVTRVTPRVYTYVSCMVDVVPPRTRTMANFLLELTGFDIVLK